MRIQAQCDPTATVLNVCVKTFFMPAFVSRSRSVTAFASDFSVSPGTRSVRSFTRTTEMDPSFQPTGVSISHETYSSELATALCGGYSVCHAPA